MSRTEPGGDLERSCDRTVYNRASTGELAAGILRMLRGSGDFYINRRLTGITAGVRKGLCLVNTQARRKRGPEIVMLQELLQRIAAGGSNA